MLYKRGRIWWTSFIGPEGRRVRRSLQTGDRRLAEANEAATQEKAQVEKDGRLWDDAVARWIEEATKSTIDNDLSQLRWLYGILGNTLLNDIGPDVVREIRQAKLDEGSSNATVNRHLALTRAILRKARDEWGWGNPVPKVKMLPEPKRRIRWLTRQEAQTLLNELPCHLAGPAAFTLATGLRAGNVRGLRWDHIQIDRRVAVFSGDEMKSGVPLGIPLNDAAVKILVERQGNHPRYVFTYGGEKIGRLNSKSWQAALRRAGIEDFRWHDLRHTWASWHVQAGTPIEVLKELGGWASLAMVLRYAHLAPSHLAQYADNLTGEPTA